MPWPKILALALGEDALEAEALDFHLLISMRMSTHLRLALDNMTRTQWNAGALLSTDTTVAKEAANMLHDHLLRTPEGSRTRFEQAIAQNEQLMLELGLFKEASPPCLL